MKTMTLWQLFITTIVATHGDNSLSRCGNSVAHHIGFVATHTTLIFYIYSTTQLVQYQSIKKRKSLITLSFMFMTSTNFIYPFIINNITTDNYNICKSSDLLLGFPLKYTGDYNYNTITIFVCWYHHTPQKEIYRSIQEFSDDHSALKNLMNCYCRKI